MNQIQTDVFYSFDDRGRVKFNVENLTDTELYYSINMFMRNSEKYYRKDVRLRDNEICALCWLDCKKEKIKWEAHHIVLVDCGGGCLGLDNVITLCITCHKAQPKIDLSTGSYNVKNSRQIKQKYVTALNNEVYRRRVIRRNERIALLKQNRKEKLHVH